VEQQRQAEADKREPLEDKVVSKIVERTDVRTVG